MPQPAGPRPKRSSAPIGEVIPCLKEAYPDARTELVWEDPLQLLVATILSAQSTDVRVNEVTKGLFEKYRAAEDYAEADLAELEEKIRPVGFFRNKARSLKGMAHALVEDHGGVVPEGERVFFSHLRIFHGRRVCQARKPDCPGCVLNHVCPSAFRV